MKADSGDVQEVWWTSQEQKKVGSTEICYGSHVKEHKFYSFAGILAFTPGEERKVKFFNILLICTQAPIWEKDDVLLRAFAYCHYSDWEHVSGKIFSRVFEHFKILSNC